MTKKQRQEELDRLEDLMCNTDYLTSIGELIYSIYQRSADRIEAKQLGEY